MAAANTANPALTMHLDPWHKMLAGSIEPRVYAVGKANSAKLAAQHVSSQSDAEPKRSILLFDPMRGPSEFLLLEYRTCSALGFDQAAVNSGLVVWQMALNAANRPFNVPRIARTARARRCRSRRCLSAARPTGNWAETWPFSLRWMDGTDSGVRVTVERHDAVKVD